MVQDYLRVDSCHSDKAVKVGKSEMDIKPFQRRAMDSEDFERRFLREIVNTLKLLNEECHGVLLDEYNNSLLCIPENNENEKENLSESSHKRSRTISAQNGKCKLVVSEPAVQMATDVIAQRWKLKDSMSEMTLRGLLVILEHLLSHQITNNNAFAHFVDALGYHAVLFWKKAVPLLYESDMQYSTNYRDALLFSITLYDVNNGRNRLRELFAAVPGLRNSLMAKSAKRFEESFHVMMQRRSAASSLASSRRNSLGGESAKTAQEEAASLLQNGQLDSSSLTSTSLLDNLGDLYLQDDEDVEAANYEVDRTLHAEDASAWQHQKFLLATLNNGGNNINNSNNSNNNNNQIVRNRSTSQNGVVGATQLDEAPRSLSQLFEFPTPLSNGDESSLPPPRRFDRQTSNTSSASGAGVTGDQPSTVLTGLCSGHFQERVINVSNAPPVSLKLRRESGQWELGQGSGGLVSCCDPVMNKDHENVWLACFGPDVPIASSRSDVNSPLPARTNCLGLPIIRQTPVEVQFSMLQEPRKNEEDEGALREIRDQMSVLGILRNYNKENYKLNPVVVDESDYHTYYGGISNGLLWPALHSLPQYIVKDYDDLNILTEHWNAYVRVNYQFALNAVRKSRPQDFLWIHDYHLMLTGLIIQSLDSNIEVGFFLHIPFQPNDEFFTKFKIVAEAVVRGLIRFTKVGFQTHLDRQSFVNILLERFPMARVQYNATTDKHVVTYEGFSSTLGVFPVSIKNEDFLSVANNPEVLENSRVIRQSVLGNRPSDGKFFFSVERFDYTKGIKEKLEAYTEYFKRHPDRVGKDVFVQVAVINRRSVESYREYQDMCTTLVQKLNSNVKCLKDPLWKPIIFHTDGLTRPVLVAHYLAMDIGVVTPEKDGMNLVAKEMLICNSKASLVISCGAGTEQQLNSAGFYSESNHCYHRIGNIHDTVTFANTLYAAATEDQMQIEAHGKKLNEFLMANDIEKWSSTFLDPSWSHDVIQPVKLHTLMDFHMLLFQARNVRRKIVENVLNGYPTKPHFAISLRNVRQSLNDSLNSETNRLHLTAAEGPYAKIAARFDVTDELCQLDIDLDFLNYVQGDPYSNLETFLQDLSKYHPSGPDDFQNELEKVSELFNMGDHFDYFFSDRDGTLRSYACTYPSSIQGAYSGVIQATFAQRCTQYAAIVTSAPLQNIGILDVTVVPDGYYSYGASLGREWYLNSKKRFKDTSVSNEDLELCEKVADKIAELLERPLFRQFSYLGSGLQRLYGLTTVARQDVSETIEPKVSEQFSNAVLEVVNELDPGRHRLHIMDTGTDIKILLKARLSGNIFNKGHGIRLFRHRMKLDLSKGNILVCGDSETDIPMLKEALMINPKNTYTVWVTKNDDLRTEVTELCMSANCRNFAFVTSPFVILGAMANATIREIQVRPTTCDDVTTKSDVDFLDDDDETSTTTTSLPNGDGSF